MDSNHRNTTHLRILGSNPVFDVQASSLGVILGSNTSDDNVRFDLWNNGESRYVSFAQRSGGDVLISTADSNGALYLGENEIASMRVGSNQVRIDTDTWLQSNLVLNKGDIVVTEGGTIHATRYDNLIDDFTTNSLTMPPTANALAHAFVTLSNLIVSRIVSQSSQSSTNPGSSPYAPSSSSEDIKVGKLACTDVTTGSFLAYTYCNLVVDFRGNAYMDQPVSAFALTRAYTQLSNYVQTELASVGTLLQAGFSPADAFNNSTEQFIVSDGRWQSDMWLPSSDGFDRLYFDSDGSMDTACTQAIWRASPATPPSLRLSMTNTDDGGASLRLSGSMTLEDIHVLRSINLADVSELRLPSWLTLDVASITAATYCNLPIASASRQGIVTLMPSNQWPDASMSNLAATGANLALITSNMDQRFYDITSLHMESLYASHIASNLAGKLLQEYEIDAYSLYREYHSNLMVPGVKLVSHANDSNDAGACFEIQNDEGSILRMSLAADNLALVGNDGGPLTLYGGGDITQATSVLTIDDGKVSVVSGESAPQVIPPVPLLSDNENGYDYIVSSSSTYSSDAWAQAFQAFSGDTRNGWVSASHYDNLSGAPSTLTSDVTHAPPISVRGEWLQLTLPEDIAYTHLRSFFVQTTNANARPDNFVVTVLEPDATEWKRVAFYEHQSEFLDDGMWYVLPQSVQIRSFRIIITKVALRPNTSYYPTITEIDVLRLRMGSAPSTSTDALFVVGNNTIPGLVVSQDGQVGIRQSVPSAMLHFGNAIDPRMIVLYDRDATSPNAHEFRGMGVAQDGLTLQLDGSNTSLIVQSGRGSDVPDELLLKVSGSDGSVHTQGSLRFNGELVHEKIGTEEWAFIDSNGTFKAGPLLVDKSDKINFVADHTHVTFQDRLSFLSDISSNTCGLTIGSDSPLLISGRVDVNSAIVTSSSSSLADLYPRISYSNAVTGLALSNVVSLMCMPESGEGIVHVTNKGPLLLNPDGGDVIVHGVPAQTLSDASLGRDVVPIQDAIVTLSKLIPRMYRKLPSPDSQSLGATTTGFLAQEMVQDAPELEHLIHSTLTSSGPMSSINYVGLIAYLVRALQEHEERLFRIERMTF